MLNPIRMWASFSIFVLTLNVNRLYGKTKTTTPAVAIIGCPLGVLTCSLLWAVLLYLSLWRHCFRILFSGDSRADGTCGMERIGASRHDLPIVPLYCGYLVSVLTREATRKRYDGRGDL